MNQVHVGKFCQFMEPYLNEIEVRASNELDAIPEDLMKGGTLMVQKDFANP